MSGSMALWQPRSVLMSMPPIIIEDHLDASAATWGHASVQGPLYHCSHADNFETFSEAINGISSSRSCKRMMRMRRMMDDDDDDDMMTDDTTNDDDHDERPTTRRRRRLNDDDAN
ncbi:hypothetical protein STEG23_034992 [Scotinomys teguina]